MADGTTSSYIDVAKLTSPDFSPYIHANALVLGTNNPSDPSIDLTTPLSKVLFDQQEIDSSIHGLTSRSALDILTYTSTQNQAAARILTRLEEERTRLNASYARLEREILGRHSKATIAKLQAERSHQLLKLGRGVQKVLSIGRQLEAQLSDAGLPLTQPTSGPNRASKEDHRLILRAANIVLAFRETISSPDGVELGKINLVRTVRGRIFEDGEARILDFARRVIREFSVSLFTNTAGSSYKEAEDSKFRFADAVDILYLLSPAPALEGHKLKKADFEPEYLLRALQSYLQTAITTSTAALARGLAQPQVLDRSLLEVSARCENVVAFEAILRDISPPEHPLIVVEKLKPAPPANEESDQEDSDQSDGEESVENVLDLLLESLDTSSLPSYFWRSLASQISPKVQDLVNRGGMVARTLRGNRDEIRNQVRDCVLRGSRMPSTIAGPSRGGKDIIVGNWEREAAVMSSAVIGPLGR